MLLFVEHLDAIASSIVITELRFIFVLVELRLLVPHLALEHIDFLTCQLLYEVCT